MLSLCRSFVVSLWEVNFRGLVVTEPDPRVHKPGNPGTYRLSRIATADRLVLCLEGAGRLRRNLRAGRTGIVVHLQGIDTSERLVLF